MAGPPFRQFDHVPCLACKSTRFATIRGWNDVSHIARCLDCGLEFVNPLPGEDYLRRLYHDETRSGGAGNPYYLDYIRERKERLTSYNKQFHSRLRLIERFNREKGKILDIGCGAGFFLQAARARGWVPYGVDIVPEFVQFAGDELRLDNVRCGSLPEMNFPRESFDTVTLWDLIEHLRNPLDWLNEVNRILRPGGQVVIWTPNVKNAVYAKERWYGYGINQHLYFFSSRTLGRLLTRSGFRKIFEQTTRAKKGFFPRPPPAPYREKTKAVTVAGRIWRAGKRDLKNLLNPATYLSPVLDKAGYGFNLLVIAAKTGAPPAGNGNP